MGITLNTLGCLLLMVTACRPGEPTPTPVPPTPATGTVVPTRTLVPPSATPLLPTATAAEAPTSTPTEPDRSTVAGEIGAGIKELAAQGRFSGALLVAQEGEPILKQAYGQADRALDLPNQVDTKFNLGSMDKMFTAVAIMQLVEQGRLALDDVIADHLPDYPNQEVANAVTIHHLLTHTSGLGDYSESDRYKAVHDQIRSLEDYVPLFVDTPLEFEPGEQFLYSNSGFIVLGLIIEEVTGQSYYDYVRLNIFEPSGMTDTGAYELDAGTPNLAWGYTRFDAEHNVMNIYLDLGYTTIVLTNSDEDCTAADEIIRAALLP